MPPSMRGYGSTAMGLESPSAKATCGAKKKQQKWTRKARKGQMSHPAIIIQPPSPETTERAQHQPHDELAHEPNIMQLTESQTPNIVYDMPCQEDAQTAHKQETKAIEDTTETSGKGKMNATGNAAVSQCGGKN